MENMLNTEAGSCNLKNTLEAVYIFDNDGNTLVSYSCSKIDSQLIEAVKSNYNVTRVREKLYIYRLNCHKIWYIRVKGVIFSILTNSSLSERVSRHILTLIIKPFFQGYKDDLKLYNTQKRLFQLYADMLKGVCYPPFIDILCQEYARKG